MGMCAGTCVLLNFKRVVIGNRQHYSGRPDWLRDKWKKKRVRRLKRKRRKMRERSKKTTSIIMEMEKQHTDNETYIPQPATPQALIATLIPRKIDDGLEKTQIDAEITYLVCILWPCRLCWMRLFLCCNS